MSSALHKQAQTCGVWEEGRLPQWTEGVWSEGVVLSWDCVFISCTLKMALWLAAGFWAP